MSAIAEKGGGSFHGIKLLTEARRVLKPGWCLVIGFIERESPIEQDYRAHQAENVFYREATFYSADEVERLLGETGFAISAWGQTLAHPLPEIREIDLCIRGAGVAHSSWSPHARHNYSGAAKRPGEWLTSLTRAEGEK